MIHEYAIRYGESLVNDTSWNCIADVIQTYHGTSYISPEGQVTGILVRRLLPDGDWEVVAREPSTAPSASSTPGTPPKTVPRLPTQKETP